MLQNVSLRSQDHCNEALMCDCCCSCLPLMLVVMTALRPASWSFASLAPSVSSSSTSKTSVSSTWQPKSTPFSQPLYMVSDDLLQATQASHWKNFFYMLSGNEHWSLFDVLNFYYSIIEMKSSGPVPVPRYAKNRLIALCKDIAFRVKCTACSKVLTSHMEAKAHFK